MKWTDIFKIYNLKKIRVDKILFLFTSISILIATSISLIIPVVNIENQKYTMKNLKTINGGDLSIVLMGEQPENFYKKLDQLEKDNFEIKTSSIQNCYYKKGSNNIMGVMSIGDYSLNDDEIILQNTLAKSLNAHIGDYIELDTRGNGKYKYKVKDIESLYSGVTRDAKLLGYGKINKTNNSKNIEGTSYIVINGKNIEKIKKELIEINNANQYSTLKDVKQENSDDLTMQKVVLSILSTVAYIFSALAIISTSLMIILKTKKDIATLRLLSFNPSSIKKAFMLEFSIWILLPILFSEILSFLSIKHILNYAGIIITSLSKESLISLFKGFIFNTLVFFILIYVALKIIDGIKAMAVIREDETELKKQNRRIAIWTILLIPLLLILYSISCDNIENIYGILAIILLLTFFLALTSVFIKLFSKVHFKNNIMIYSLNSIKKRFSSFLLILMSLTITLCFILIGFNLEHSLKENFKQGFANTLPYNYYVEGTNDDQIEQILTNDSAVKGFSRYSSIDGKIKNKEFYDKFVTISEINKEDYKLKYKLISGKNLFEGKEGFVIPDTLKDQYNINLGDVLEVQTPTGTIKEKIKGVYKSGGLNSSGIIKENVSLGYNKYFLVNSTNNNFINELTNSTVVSISDMGNSMSSYFSSFLKIFRLLSIICLFGTILFNINMIFMNCIQDQRDEEILMALGYNKNFIIKSQIVKMLIITFISSLLSLGIYSIVIKFFISMMTKISGNISFLTIISNIILSIVISIISFIPAIRNIIKRKELSLLREEL